jgi:hypothetical protein
MYKKIILMLSFAIIVISCTQRPTVEKTRETSPQPVLSENEKSFLNNLSSLCGNSYAGKETYIEPGRESWADKKFIMHVTVCEPHKVHIPFHLDEDRSRTWMFLTEEHGLRFRHDHRHEDGTPEDQTLYGGYADGSGTAYIQRFPADDYTNAMLDDDHARQWNIILAEDLSTMTYQLLYQGELIFEAQFDLSRPIVE